jgi:hypothetical protein
MRGGYPPAHDAGRQAAAPRLDAAVQLARRIVATRENVGQFSSVADLGFVLDLDPDTTARRDRDRRLSGRVP